MKIPIFELERVQSIYENTVEFNLTESGFHPLTLSELLTPEQIAELTRTVLGYGQTNGSIALRKRIVELYPGQTIDNVLVTNGSAEANFVACHSILETGDEVVMMVPNYMQIWGIVEEMRGVPKAFHLREENGWAPDLDELRALVNAKTKMIVVCNPNNPTGYTLTGEEMQEIVGIADSWAYHDYTSIAAGILSNRIAEIALSPDVRPGILERNRSTLRHNLQIMVDWLATYGDLFHFVPPKAGGMAFMRYDLEINSTELADWLRTTKSVFILAGDCYGMDHYIRVGIGAEEKSLVTGLSRIRDALKERFSV